MKMVREKDAEEWDEWFDNLPEVCGYTNDIRLKFL